MTRKKSRAVWNALLLAVVFALTVYSVLRGEDPARIVSALKMADAAYVIPAVLCMVLFMLGEAVIIRCMLGTLGTRTTLRRCCLYSFTGFFYSCITPSASGGQPMQVIAMRRDNIPVAISSVVLAIVTITYKLVLVLIGLAVMLLRPRPVMRYLADLDGLIYLGVALNVTVVAALLLLVFRPELVRRFARALVRLIDRIRPIRRIHAVEERLEETMVLYTGAAEYCRTHPFVMVQVFLLTLVQRICLFLTTFLAYRAFGLSGESVVTVTVLQAMVSVIVDMLPLPGGMGVSENLFLEIFTPLFGSALVLPGLMISRGVSYYCQLILSAVMTLICAVIQRRKD